MKKNVLKFILPAALFFLFILVQGCNQGGNEQAKSTTDTGEHAQSEQLEGSHEHQNTSSDKLALNNGAKWKADESTNKNVALLVATGNKFSTSSKRTLEDYHGFGKDISAGINKMINECTMKGAADEALHHWFLPVLQQTKTLGDATDTTGLGSVASGMIDRLHIYPNYFE